MTTIEITLGGVYNSMKIVRVVSWFCFTPENTTVKIRYADGTETYFNHAIAVREMKK